MSQPAVTKKKTASLESTMTADAPASAATPRSRIKLKLIEGEGCLFTERIQSPVPLVREGV
jgi:hypothetical protein